MPMTDDDIGKLSRGALNSSAMVDDDMRPIGGGLFDVGKTGGPDGRFWTHVNLAEPMPNPVFEEPIRRLLKLRKQDFQDVIAGRQELDGMTGGAAIKGALEQIDIDADAHPFDNT